jgi:8-oxo-dGTP pyrophosphatase MutT (NUDIX family)
MEKLTDYILQSNTKDNKKDNVDDNILSNKVEYDGYLKIMSNNNYEWVKEKDCIVFLPYLVQHNSILLRMEPVPPYKERFPFINKFTVIGSGSIEENEQPLQTLKRELKEEFGLVIRENFEFNIKGPLMMTKGNSAQYYYCILPLYDYDYQFITASGDGTLTELESDNFRFNVNQIEHLETYDLITEFVISKFRTIYHC